jgi:mycofactocin glycosyltransferase
MSTTGTRDDRPVEVSVIIPVRDRADQLGQALGALARQSYPQDRFEVLVCDDGSAEDLGPALARGAGLRLVVLRQGPRGAGAARNLGLAYARGEVVAFTDSDCIPAPGWLVALTRAFDDPAVGLAGGPYSYRGATHLSGRCLNFLLGRTLGTGAAMIPRRGATGQYCPITGNLAVRAAAARAAGGFPESSYGEDLEFGDRVCRLGVGSYYARDAEVLHDERRGLAQVAAANFRKGAARVHLLRCCRMHRPVHVLPAVLLAYLVAAATAAAVRPGLVLALSVPLAAYGLALALLAAQGGRAIGPVAVAAIPVYAAVMHLSYGAGYWSALLRPGGGRGGGRR